MKDLIVKIQFEYSDGSCNTYDVKLTVPSSMDVFEVMDIIEKEHKYLKEEDEEATYCYQGRVPGTLIDYVCEKYGWTWGFFHYDIELNCLA